MTEGSPTVTKSAQIKVWEAEGAKAVDSPNPVAALNEIADEAEADSGQPKRRSKKATGEPKAPVENAPCHDFIHLNEGHGTSHFHLCAEPVAQEAPYMHGGTHKCVCGFIWGHPEGMSG